MTPELWQRLKPLYNRAIEMQQPGRTRFIDEACGTDAELRNELELLLRAADELGASTSDVTLDPEMIGSKRAFLSEGEIILGRFQILRHLGTGGMGEVYEAIDLELGRIALKTIRYELTTNQELLYRFKKEVQLARRVSSPNVCRIHEFFSAERAHSVTIPAFLTMEFLEGMTLADKLRDVGPLTWLETKTIALDICSGLKAIHSADIIHRDLKCQNIMLVPRKGSTCAVLMDFGVAHELSDATHNTLMEVTKHGALVGTPSYMAPEQFAGEALSPATDLYALGVILYEVLTGEHPFRGSSPIAAAIQRGRRLPSVSSRRSELPTQWDEIVGKCLEFRAEDRYQSAAELEKDLESLLPGERQRPRSGSWPLLRRLAGLPRLRLLLVVTMAGLLVAGGVVARLRFYDSRRSSKPLTDKDTIVVSDFVNTTGDAVFDDTLKAALTISLRQSPYLNLLSDDRVRATLKLMMNPPGTPLTPEVTREICQRAGIRAYVAGTITSLGSKYVLGLKAVNCQKGETLAQEQITATSKEKVLDTLGEAASRLRRELGESLVTVDRFCVPLEQATTSSLEALKAYSNMNYELAVELDPNFALAYWMAGIMAGNMGNRDHAAEYLTRAFQLRDHASEREKLMIAGSYYADVTGELDKAERAFRGVIYDYPRLLEFEAMEASPHVILGNIYLDEGRYDEAERVIRQSLELVPHHAPPYFALCNALLGLQRFEEARQVVREGQTRASDGSLFHYYLYALAFLAGDSTAMAIEQKELRGRSNFENAGLALASDTEAYRGHLVAARQLTERAVDTTNPHDKASAAVFLAIAAQREAAFGELDAARKDAHEALKLAHNDAEADVESILALAFVGETPRAESLAQDLQRRFPLNAQMQTLWLPTIHAEIALQRKNPVLAVKALQPALAMELGQLSAGNNISCLYPVFVRGQAYLAAGQGDAAAAEFQKILDHSGIVWNCWTGALAQLGVGRANALESRTLRGTDADAARLRALAAYEQFLTLLNDADPDLSVLRAAKVEYASLRQSEHNGRQ